MLAWTKALIKLRRCTVALNDGNMHHLMVSSDDKRMTLVMQREEARILVNLGTEPQHFDLLDGECLCLISSDGPMKIEGLTARLVQAYAGLRY